MSLELDQQRVFGVSTLINFVHARCSVCLLSDLSGESQANFCSSHPEVRPRSKVLAVESLGPQEVFLLSASYELRHQVCPVHCCAVLCSAVQVVCRITLIPLESCLWKAEDRNSWKGTLLMPENWVRMFGLSSQFVCATGESKVCFLMCEVLSPLEAIHRHIIVSLLSWLILSAARWALEFEWPDTVVSCSVSFILIHSHWVLIVYFNQIYVYSMRRWVDS